MNELKKLTWKYFWQQKWEETRWWIFGVTGFIFIPLLTGKLISNIFEINKYISSSGFVTIDNWFLGLFSILFIAMGIALVALIICIIMGPIATWIKGNWTMAKKRAKKELKKK